MIDFIVRLCPWIRYNIYGNAIIWGMLRGHSQGSCRACAAHSHDYAIQYNIYRNAIIWVCRVVTAKVAVVHVPHTHVIMHCAVDDLRPAG